MFVESSVFISNSFKKFFFQFLMKAKFYPLVNLSNTDEGSQKKII